MSEHQGFRSEVFTRVFTIPQLNGTVSRVGQRMEPVVIDREQEALRKRRLRQEGKLRHEKMRLKTRLTGFNYQASPSWLAICQHFGSQPSHEELRSVAELIAKTANIRLDRDAKRRKIVMLKWFEEHWDVVSYFLRFIALEEDNDGEDDE